MAILTDLPSRAIQTRRKMSSSAGNVPFKETSSHEPLVASATAVGWTGSGVVVVVVAAGVVELVVVGGMIGTVVPGVVVVCVVSPGAGGTTGGWATVSGGGAAEGFGEGSPGLVDSCWTNGSLLLNRPNESSLSGSGWTTT